MVRPRTRCLWAHEFENCDRVDLALNVALAKAATLKVLRDRTLGTLAEVDFARPGELLEAGGEVGRIAHGCVVHPKVIADLTDDHETRMQPHADRELHSVLSGQLPLPRSDGLTNSQRRQHGPSGVILVGKRRPEQCHETITQELVDRTLVPVDLIQCELEELVQQCVHCLRAEPLRQGRRVRNVAEEHRKLLALAFQGGFRGQDLFGEVLGGVGLRRSETGRLWTGRWSSAKGRSAAIAELTSSRDLGTTARTNGTKCRPALSAE